MKKNLIVLGAIISGIGASVYFLKSKIKKRNSYVVSPKRFEVGFHLLNEWMILKQKNRNLVQYFIDHNINSIAIYGMGVLGQRLYDDLKGTGIEVKYGIDRIASSKHMDELKIYSLEERVEDIPLIVVTPIQDYDEIEDMLMTKVSGDIVSLEDIVKYCTME